MFRRILSFCLLPAFCAAASAQSRIDVPFSGFLHNRSDTLSIVIIGDVMMHSTQLEYDSSSFLEGISSWLKDADFACANMEFTLAGKPYSGYPSFSAPDEYAKNVKDSGVNVFLTANNHILDKGHKGLCRTLDIYRGMNIPFTGTARTQEEKESNYPLILECNGISVALINFTYGTNAPKSKEWPAVNLMETNDIKSAFCRAQDQGADFILALPHWGNEYELTHSAVQYQWASKLVEYGADAIVGCHPHVVQDSTHINGVPVIFSTGNLISNMSAKNTRLGLAVKIRFVTEQNRARMLEPELRFIWCTLPGRLTNNYRTIFVDEWTGRRDEWLQAYDYDNMIWTYHNVKRSTKIENEENN